MIDISKLTRTVRTNERGQIMEQIRSQRAKIEAMLVAGRIRHADLEAMITEQAKQNDAMFGALKAYDDVLASLAEECHAPTLG